MRKQRLLSCHIFTMASRRSSRLSAVSANTYTVTASSPNGAVDTLASKKRKISNSAKSDKPQKASKKEQVSKASKASSDGFAVPITPKKKAAAVIPETPTPALAKAMGLPHRAGETEEPPLNRLADPHGTNAPLFSPESSRVLMNKTADSTSPSKPAALQSKITTGNILEKALAHLIEMEPKLKSVIERHPCSVFSPEGLAEEIDPFNSLVSSIISQQVSGAAAKSIKAKFVGLFNTGDPETHVFPAPSQVATKTIETLRTAGLSQRKAEYVQGLAEKFASGELSTEMLMKAEYEEVLEKLIAVRGLGKWSVEMFACFGLKRMDVFSTGDLGVQYVTTYILHI